MIRKLPGARGDVSFPLVTKVLTALAVTAPTSVWIPGATNRFRLLGFALSAGTVGGTFRFMDSGTGVSVHSVVLEVGKTTVVDLGDGLEGTALAAHLIIY